MGSQQFDERYPAMFQPDGDGIPASAPWLAPAVADPAQLNVAQQPVVQAPIHLETVEMEQSDEPDAEELPDAETTGQARAGAAAEKHSVWLMWRVPAIIGALMVGMGIMVATIPGWIEKMADDPNAINAGQMWAYQSSQAAAPMIGLGLGALATVFFLYVQQHTTRQAGLRRLFTIAAAAVLVMGIFAQFAVLIFQPIPQESVDSVSGQTHTYVQTPWFASSLSMMAFGPLLVGLLMLAVLLVGRNFSRIRAYLVGLVAILAGAFAQFGQHIFPQVPPATEYYRDGSQNVPVWLYWLPQLTPALVAAGVVVIAAAAIWPAITTAIRTPRALPRLDHPDVDSGAMDQGVTHEQTEL